jgi:soluble P-type ATPase
MTDFLRTIQASAERLQRRTNSRFAFKAGMVVRVRQQMVALTITTSGRTVPTVESHTQRYKDCEEIAIETASATQFICLDGLEKLR